MDKSSRWARVGKTGRQGCFGLVVAAIAYHWSILIVRLSSFSIGLRQTLILKCMSKAPSPIAENWIRVLGEESLLNSILMLRDCVSERLTLEVVLRYGSCKLIKILNLDCKVSLWCGLTEKWQLMWIETRRIFSLFVGRLCLLQVRDCKRCYA